MSILKTVNAARRAVMKRMTKNLGITRIDRRAGPKPDIKRVLICRPNHRLGNQLLITPLLQEVTDIFPQAKIDLFVKGGLASVLFKNYPNIDRIIQLPKKPFKNILGYLRGWMAIKRNRYDIVINVVGHSSSGKISARMVNARFTFHGYPTDDIRMKYADHEHMAKYPVYSFRSSIREAGFEIDEKTVAPLDLRLSAGEIAEGKRMLKDLVKNEKRTIAIYTYATGTKCYDKAWWEDFYDRLKTAFPEFNIIEVLPIENVSQISFKAPSFYSRELRQIGAVITNTDIFIGADSGMMHLASAAHTPTVGLFQAKNMNTYVPYNKGSVGICTVDVNAVRQMEIIGSILQVSKTPAFT